MTMKFPALIFLGTALLVACKPDQPAAGSPAPSTPTIAVVNYPLAYFAERLAGDFATILFEAPADEDPAFWKPGDAEIARIQAANLILLNGAGYAKWTTTTSLPFETTVDTSTAFSSDLIEVEEAVTHSHGEGEADHSHGGTAFTTWMDLKQAIAQATAAAEAITETWPDRKEAVTKNLAALTADLQELDRAMAAAAARFQSAPLIASHPVYQYWERAYGLTVPSLLWEPEMDLDDSALADLRKLRETHPGANFFIWEGDPLPGHIETLKELGLTSLVVSPGGNRPESGDFLSLMKKNVEVLSTATP